jgi:hypothetical protein
LHIYVPTIAFVQGDENYMTMLVISLNQLIEILKKKTLDVKKVPKTPLGPDKGDDISEFDHS